MAVLQKPIYIHAVFDNSLTKCAELNDPLPVAASIDHMASARSPLPLHPVQYLALLLRRAVFSLFHNAKNHRGYNINIISTEYTLIIHYVRL